MSLESRYSRNDEDFIFNSVQDALEDLDADGELVVGAEVYEIKVKPLQAKDVLSSMQMYDILQDNLYEAVGESADLFSLTTDQCNELHNHIANWLVNNTNLTTFWTTEGASVKHIVTEELIKEYES